MKILDINLFEFDVARAVGILIGESRAENKLISATSAHGLVLSKRNPEFKKILDDFFLNLPDGMPSVWIGRLKGASHMSRCYGPDFFEAVMRKTADTTFTHFLCGGNEGVAESLKIVCETNFGAKIVGTYTPPFLPVSNYNFEDLANIIKQSGAKICWIGLSTPKQEEFAIQLSQYTRIQFICCVGAAFDFHIQKIRQAPKWIQGLGLEWLFRLTNEPKRLWRRYISVIPLFIFYNFAELLNGKFFKVK